MGRAARRCLQERHRLVQLRAHFSSGSSGKRRELQPQTLNRLGAGESTARLEENLMKTMRYVLLSNMLLVVAMASPRLQAQASPQAGTSEAVNAEDLPAVSSYWTPERLAAAKPMDLTKVDPGVTPSSTHAPEKGPQGFSKGALPTASMTSDLSQPLIQALGENTAGPVVPGFNYIYPFDTYSDPQLQHLPGSDCRPVVLCARWRGLFV